MVGVELVIDGDPHQPATSLTAEVLKACVSRGLLIIGAGDLRQRDSIPGAAW